MCVCIIYIYIVYDSSDPVNRDVRQDNVWIEIREEKNAKLLQRAKPDLGEDVFFFFFFLTID